MKKTTIPESGFVVEESEMNPDLFPFQKHCVKRALKCGKYALFENTGLGKTIQQLEWAYQIHLRVGGDIVIIAPLAVVGQTIDEGHKFGYKVARVGDSGDGIYITNYDQIPNLNVKDYVGVVLDESSILKNFDGATKQLIIDSFKGTPYKLACTATPSPNDVMELGNHAEFLDVMSRNEMLAMYFIHDGGNTSSWRLKGHCEQMFWDFVSDWATMIEKPSDIGFSDEGYILPPLHLIEDHIETAKRDNWALFNDMAVNATNYNEELRQTVDERMQRVAEIVNASNENFIIWIKQDKEGDILRSLIPDAVEVRGSERPEVKESKLLGFGRNEYRVLVTKLKIAQFGLNYQNCHNQIFASLDFSFESTYQGIRRCYRFGQTEEVNIILICTDTMQNVRETIQRKQEAFEDMQKKMTEATNRNISAKNKFHQTRGTVEMSIPKFITNYAS
ncbi:MAG: hypothetical protein IIZ90_03620 [Bacteroidales bacterium]|nr:hypothetical protein [Bacteroidales bacterium]